LTLHQLGQQIFGIREMARRWGSHLERPQSFVGKNETGERRLDFVETIHVAERSGSRAAISPVPGAS
jgi:hypothetical protein